jgi:hypothetical protein
VEIFDQLGIIVIIAITTTINQFCKTKFLDLLN